MEVYLRYIHKISQNPEADTVGPYKLTELDLDHTWQWLRGQTGARKSRAHDGEHREQDGGLVYFLGGTFHSLMVMPVESLLHKKHAPPSHFEEGGPLHDAN